MCHIAVVAVSLVITVKYKKYCYICLIKLYWKNYNIGKIMAIIQSVRGTKDTLPNEIYKWQKLEEIARKVSERYGYKELRTPLFEKTEVFSRGVGDGTDIVNKEMYSFADRGGESITLRPEQTAALVRAVIQNNLLTENPATRLYYIGSYFRYERPQKGRLREFHQYGAECLNSPYPESDVEVICLAVELINKLGINNYNLRLNSLGNEVSRANYRNVLINFLESHKEKLSEESTARLATNPLRVLDSKNPIDIEITSNAPNILDSLDSESIRHFDEVQKLLTVSKINYEISPNLVRGLDYYSHTVFEFQSTELGAQDAFGGGGRYNSLFAELGGKDTPAVGFAMGLERLLLILEQIQGQATVEKVDAIIIPTNEKYVEIAMQVANILRNKLEFSCILDINRRSMKAQLREANKLEAKWAIIIGDDEVAADSVSLKFMLEKKEQELIKIANIETYFAGL